MKQLFILWWLMAGLALPAIAAESESLASPSGPIEVTSRQMEAEQQNGTVVFTGEVVAKRGTMTVYAETLTLYFAETESGRKIERLNAQGGVRVVDGQRIATSRELSYLQAEEKMILRGDAQIHQGDNQVEGEEIVLFLRENRSLVKSGKDGRVKAVFLPEQETP